MLTHFFGLLISHPNSIYEMVTPSFLSFHHHLFFRMTENNVFPILRMMRSLTKHSVCILPPAHYWILELSQNNGVTHPISLIYQIYSLGIYNILGKDTWCYFTIALCVEVEKSILHRWLPLTATIHSGILMNWLHSNNTPGRSGLLSATTSTVKLDNKYRKKFCLFTAWYPCWACNEPLLEEEVRWEFVGRSSNRMKWFF